MVDPAEILQKTIRSTLIDSPDVLALLAPDHIRSGSTVPANFPCVIMAAPQTVNLGRAAAGLYATRVYIDLHIWAQEHGAGTAQQIGAVLTHVLWDCPEARIGPFENNPAIAEYERPSFKYMRDPDPDKSYSHGVGTVEAAILWRP